MGQIEAGIDHPDQHARAVLGDRPGARLEQPDLRQHAGQARLAALLALHAPHRRRLDQRLHRLRSDPGGDEPAAQHLDRLRSRQAAQQIADVVRVAGLDQHGGRSFSNRRLDRPGAFHSRAECEPSKTRNRFERLTHHLQ